MGFNVEIFNFVSIKFKTIVHYDIIFQQSNFTSADHNILINTNVLHLGEHSLGFCYFTIIYNLFVVVKVYFAYDNFFVYGSEQHIYLTLCLLRGKPKRP